MFVRRNYYDTQDPFIQIFDKALKQIAKNYDCKAESFDAGSSVLLQKDQLNKAFENESALIVNLIDPAMADEVVANAQATNSRLIFFNRKPSDSALEAYDNAWYVGTSSKLAGKYQAQIVFDFLSETKQFDKNQNGLNFLFHWSTVSVDWSNTFMNVGANKIKYWRRKIAAFPLIGAKIP